MLSEGEVKEGNRVWHVDSGLNPSGALNGQLLKFNCRPCLLGRPCEHWWGIFQSYWGRWALVESPFNPVSRDLVSVRQLTPVCSPGQEVLCGRRTTHHRGIDRDTKQKKKCTVRMAEKSYGREQVQTFPRAGQCSPPRTMWKSLSSVSW